MAEADSYLTLIRTRHPELSFAKAHLQPGGQYNDVVMPDNGLVFRFPRCRETIRRLVQSTRVLEQLRGRVELRLPAPLFSNLEGEPGEVYVAYERIPGETVRRGNFESVVGNEAMKMVAHQLGAFLAQLHDLPVSLVTERPVGLAVNYDYWADFYRRTQRLLFSHLGPVLRKRVATHFETFFEREERAGQAEKPRLVHGDFGASNILLDRVTQGVTGIIDFDSVGPGDPATDVAALRTSYGPRFVDEFAMHYPLTSDVAGRVQFYIGTFALQEALYGLEHNDTEALKRGIAGIRCRHRSRV